MNEILVWGAWATVTLAFACSSSVTRAPGEGLGGSGVTGGTAGSGGSGGSGGTGGVSGSTQIAECHAANDFNACDDCCMTLYPEGIDEWLSYEHDCACGPCAEPCAGWCAGEVATDECADCAISCVEGRCIASPGCAPYLACYKPCERYDGISVLQAARQTAAADCDRLVACAPARLAWLFGTRDTCVERATDAWLWEAMLPGSGWTPATLMACGNAWSASSCEEHLYSRLPRRAECQISGTRMPYEPCLAHSQCDTGFCLASGPECGYCTAPPAQGDACSEDHQCDVRNGQACGPGSTCALLAAPGEPCGDYAYCDYDSECMGTSGTCAPLATEAGSPCGVESGAPGCNTDAGLLCDESLGQCVSYTLAAVGESCGYADAAFVLCAALGRCVTEATGDLRCQPGPAAGEACDGATYSHCTYPDLCHAGTCHALPLPYTCG